MELTVLFCGGRDFTDREAVRSFVGLLPEGTIVVHGAARGADALVDEECLRIGAEVRSYPARWDLQGPAAGPIRNKLMLEKELPDAVVAFPGGPGTRHMTAIASAAEVPVFNVRMREEFETWLRTRK